MQEMADEVVEGSGAGSDEVAEGSGGFRGGRWLMRLWRVPVQMADEVEEVSGAYS